METDKGLGVCLNVVGSVLVNLGTNFLKASFAAEAKSTKQYGIVLFSLGSLINFISFAYASQTALAALGGVQFVSNLGCGYFILKEEVTLRHIVAVLILVSGVIVSVCNASKESSGMLDAREIISLYDSNYISLLGTLAVTIGACELLYRYYDKQDALVLASRQPLQLEKDRLVRYPLAFLLKPLSFALPSAICGTQAALQGKCLSGLIRLFMKTHDTAALTSLPALMILLIFSACLTIWLTRLYQALQLFEGLLIIPLLQTCWIVMAIVQGGTFFKEFTEDLGMFFVGISLLLLGVYVLASAYSNASAHDNALHNDDNTSGYDVISPVRNPSKELCLSPRAHVFNVLSSQDLTTLVVGFPLASPVQPWKHLHHRRPEWHALPADSTQGSQHEDETSLHGETV